MALIIQHSPLNLTAGGEMTLVLKPRNEGEERLLEKHFARTRRFTVIDIEFVERVEKSFNYSFEIHLRGAAGLS